jgi:hypothetical protein
MGVEKIAFRPIPFAKPPPLPGVPAKTDVNLRTVSMRKITWLVLSETKTFCVKWSIATPHGSLNWLNWKGLDKVSPAEPVPATVEITPDEVTDDKTRAKTLPKISGKPPVPFVASAAG